MKKWEGRREHQGERSKEEPETVEEDKGRGIEWTSEVEERHY